MFKGKHDLIYKQQILQRGIRSMNQAIETENFFGVVHHKICLHPQAQQLVWQKEKINKNVVDGSKLRSHYQ